jgi:hypothetical protein
MSFLNWFLGKDDFRIPAGKPWVFHLVFKCFPGMAFSSKSDAGTTWEIHQSTMRWGSPTQGKNKSLGVLSRHPKKTSNGITILLGQRVQEAGPLQILPFTAACRRAWGAKHRASLTRWG